MKRHLLIFLGLMLCAAPLFTSCSDSDSDGSSNEFANWRERNEQYFASVHDNALGQISTAKAQYGAEWEEQCDWRAFLSYGRSADASSICAARSGDGAALYLNVAAGNTINAADASGSWAARSG